MWGTIIAAALSAAAKMYSNYKASKASKAAIGAQKDALAQRERTLNNWYNRHYNEDATQRADAQQILTMAAEQMKQRNKAAQGRAAVMGGTEEGVAAEKERNNKTYADIMGNIAAAGAKRKDTIQDKYLEAKLGLQNEKGDLTAKTENARAQNLVNAGNTAASVIGSIDANDVQKLFDKSGKEKEEEDPNKSDEDTYDFNKKQFFA